MEKNTHTPSSGDKSEKKTPQQGGNLVWYMLGLGVLLLLVVTMLGNTHEQNLSWSDLLKLVDARGAGGRGYIDVTDSSGTPLQRWRISDLQKVEIGGTSVTAKITRQKLAPISSSPEATGDARYQPVGDVEKDIALRVNRDPEEQRLEARLEKNGVEYSIKGQPSALLSYVPLLLMTGLLVHAVHVHDPPHGRRRLADGVRPQPRQAVSPRKTSTSRSKTSPASTKPSRNCAKSSSS